MFLEAIHIILPVFIIIAAIIAILLKDLIASVIALAAMSLLLSLEFFILHAQRPPLVHVLQQQYLSLL